MAVNKNFVVKNGIDVADQLILASTELDGVGIGTTQPKAKLDVGGGIQAENGYITGILTAANSFDVGPDGQYLTVNGTTGNIGVGSEEPRYALDVVSAGGTAVYVTGDLWVTEHIEGETLNIVGFTTLRELKVTGYSTFVGVGATSITVTGVGTFLSDLDVEWQCKYLWYLNLSKQM